MTPAQVVMLKEVLAQDFRLSSPPKQEELDAQLNAIQKLRAVRTSVMLTYFKPGQFYVGTDRLSPVTRECETKAEAIKELAQWLLDLSVYLTGDSDDPNKT